MSIADRVASSRVFAVGATESGKTHILRRDYVPRFPRIVVVDVTGEWSNAPRWDDGRRPTVVRGTQELRAALAANAKRGGRWAIVAALEPGGMDTLAVWLAPELHDNRPSIAALCGGLAVMCDEADKIAPGRTASPALGLWQRGRHYGVSMLAATQRPALVSRVVSSQSEQTIICRLREGADFEWARQTHGKFVEEQARKLVPRHALLVEPDHGRVWLGEPGGKWAKLQTSGK